VRDLVEVAVIEGALVVPGVEDGEDGETELLLRVGGEVGAVSAFRSRGEGASLAGSDTRSNSFLVQGSWANTTVLITHRWSTNPRQNHRLTQAARADPA